MMECRPRSAGGVRQREAEQRSHMPHDGAELGNIHVDGEAARPGLLAPLRERDEALRGELRGKVTFELIVQPLQNVILV